MIDVTLEAQDAAPSSCRHAAGESNDAGQTPAARVAADSLDDHHGTGADATRVATERALRLVLRRAAQAYDTPSRWEVRVRAALSALLALFDEQPGLAQLCIARPQGTDPAMLALHDQTVGVLARRIDDGRSRARRQPPPQTAHAVLAGAIGAIRGRLLEPESPTVADLVDPLMSFIVLPYRGAAASRGELRPPNGTS